MRTLAAVAAAALLLLAAPVALAHQGNPNYRSVVDAVTPARQGRRRLRPQLRRPPAAAQHQRPGRHRSTTTTAKPYAQLLADGTVAGQHELRGLLPQRGPPRRDDGAEGPRRRRRSGSSLAHGPRFEWHDHRVALDGQGRPAAAQGQGRAHESTTGRCRSGRRQQGRDRGHADLGPARRGGSLPLGAIVAFAALVLIVLCLAVFVVRRAARDARRPSRRRPGEARRARSSLALAALLARAGRRAPRTRRCRPPSPRARREARRAAGAGRAPLRRGGRGDASARCASSTPTGRRSRQGKAFHPGGKGVGDRGQAQAGPRRRQLHGDLPRRLRRRAPGLRRVRVHRRRGAAPAPSRSTELLRGQRRRAGHQHRARVARGVQYAAIALGLGDARRSCWRCWRPGLAAVAGAERRLGRGARRRSRPRRGRCCCVAAGRRRGRAGARAILLEGAQPARARRCGRRATGDVVRDGARARASATVWAASAARSRWLRSSRRAAGARARRRCCARLAVPARARSALLPVARRPRERRSRRSRSCCPPTSLHVLAMSAWLGGIAVLVFALRAATRAARPRPSARRCWPASSAASRARRRRARRAAASPACVQAIVEVAQLRRAAATPRSAARC